MNKYDTTFFVQVSQTFTQQYQDALAMLSFASEILSKPYEKHYAQIAEDAYKTRKNTATSIDEQFVAPLLTINNQYTWTFIAAKRLLIIETLPALYDIQLKYLQSHNVSFITNKGDRTDDEFGNSPEWNETMAQYIATSPNPIGFSA